MGEAVDQYHVEPNGTFSEEFRIGKSSLSEDLSHAAARAKELQNENVDDDPIQDMILFGGRSSQYLTIDHLSGGYIARVMNGHETN